MPHAIRIHAYGGPEQMSWETVDLPAPGPGEIRFETLAAGVNFIDTYHRTGLYKLPALPGTLGVESVGRVTAIGTDVSAHAVGDVVAVAAGFGGYATERVVPWHRAVTVPDGLDPTLVAGMMLKGMTAEYLVRRTFPVKAGDTVLFHAAAGGVGQIGVQWCKALGATVIGTAGSEDKAQIAKGLGADHVILYRTEDIAAHVKDITGGKMVDVVYDGVGKDTFEASLASLRPRGLLATFGNASGAVPPFELLRLGPLGSLFVTRPTLAGYTTRREELVESATALFDVVRSGTVKIAVNHRVPLADAAAAHRALESRATTGSTVLVP